MRFLDFGEYNVFKSKDGRLISVSYVNMHVSSAVITPPTLFKVEQSKVATSVSSDPECQLLPLLMGVCVRSWSRNWPHCMTMSV